MYVKVNFKKPNFFKCTLVTRNHNFAIRSLELGECVICTVHDIVDTFTGTMGMFGDSGLLGGLFELGVIVPSLALGVRRLHDINRTGWWLLLVFGFFPIAAIGGGILLVSFLL